jgi:hypothetical protein
MRKRKLQNLYLKVGIIYDIHGMPGGIRLVTQDKIYWLRLHLPNRDYLKWVPL